MSRFLKVTSALASLDGGDREMNYLKACIELARRSGGQVSAQGSSTQKRTTTRH